MDRRTIRPKEVKEDGTLAPGGFAVDDPINIVGHAASFFRRKPRSVSKPSPVNDALPSRHLLRHIKEEPPVGFPHAREKMAELLPEADFVSSHTRFFRSRSLQKVKYLS